MTLVDSSVWIDYFNGIAGPGTDTLDDLLQREPVAVGDLIVTEVLQGFRLQAHYETAKDLLLSLDVLTLLGERLAVKTTDNYRTLRRRGVTVRKTMDAIIATYCIEHGHTLLHQDRDFEPFARFLGLMTSPDGPE